MGKLYYKELPLFHLYDSDLTGTQKLLMTLLLVERYDVYELSCLVRMRPENVTAAFPGDFRKTEYFTTQRSRFSETETRFAVFITKKQEVFMSIRNEIKAQIVRAGFTMQEVVDLLHDEYGWSDSVSNLSAKLQRESIRYKEVVELADVLDCDIVWVKRGERR